MITQPLAKSATAFSHTATRNICVLEWLSYVSSFVRALPNKLFFLNISFFLFSGLKLYNWK